MKQYVGCKVAWSLYYFGDFISKVMNKSELWFLYNLYNWLMSKSFSVQKWSDNPNGPWEERDCD